MILKHHKIPSNTINFTQFNNNQILKQNVTSYWEVILKLMLYDLNHPPDHIQNYYNLNLIKNITNS